nr:type II toxin-antitoxin system VapC family toxin [Rhizobium sp. ACO-34A]
MIVVDSSVVVAIFEEEEDATIFAAGIVSGEGLVMAAVNATNRDGSIVRERE